MRRVIYREIAQRLRQDIESGEYEAGRFLPSEASLGEAFGASRVTVRKALEVLRSDGLVVSQQGLGWMVAGSPVLQSLDSLVTIERQLAASGRSTRREITDFGFVTPSAEVAAVLGPRVLEVGRLNLVDDHPFSRVTVWCREDLGLPLSQTQVAETSFLELLPSPPTRAVQTLGAEAMSETNAEQLGVAVGSPALVVRRTTFGDGDAPMLMSEHWFPGHLTEFVAELAVTSQPAAGPGPSLRLVSGS